MTVIVNPIITPTFTQVAAIFNGETLAALPTTSNNNITGTWSPAVNNTETTTYTFLPDASEACAINQTMIITVTQSACAGSSGNQLVNPSFEVPSVTNIGNNILTWPINGWNGVGSAPNFVKVNGVAGQGGPVSAQEGVQYLDIAGGSADFYQEFDFQCNTRVFFSGYFSVRDGQTSTGRIDILRVNSDNTTDVVAFSNQLNMPSTANIWYLASGDAVLPAGTYRFNISMGNNSNFDSACFSFDNPNVDAGSYDPLCESSSITLTGTPTDSFGSWTGSGIVDNGDGTASFNPSGLGGTAVTVTYSHFNASGFGCSQSTNITVNPLITPTFTQVDPICSGGSLDTLPLTSDNGITGTWAPVINNTETTTYTFTPDATQPDQACAITQPMTITVNPLITPTFTQVDPICNGDILALPTTSNNGVTGTWSPAMDNTATTIYTFAPDTTQPDQACAINETMEITVNPLITPTFTQVDPICNGDILALPTTSNNGVTGTWSPAMDNTATTIYTFAPDTTQPDQACAINETMEITVNPLITPTFTQVDPICNGDVLAVLPTTSNNGVTGTWSPAMDNTATTIYTFAPDTTQPDQTCAINETMEITVNPLITPTFTQVDPICNGDILVLPTTSNNGVTGTWSPAINNTATTIYTFAPDTTQPDQACAINETMEITVNPLITPTFTQVAAICNGEALAVLPTTSNNGVTGTWSPAINNTLTTTYTFVPDTTQPGQACAINETMEITVNPLITPTFTQVAAICNGEALAVLPTTSNNGVTGTWSPALDNTATTLYTFAPDTTQPGQACAINETMEITVNPLITPTFTQVAAICNGDILVLPTTSNNGVTGTWSPAMDSTATTIYTFAPDTTQPGQACAINETMEITVNPLITPTFTQVDPICNGDVLAALPTTSNNGVTGTWSPAMDNTVNTMYTFAPDTTQPGQACAINETMVITVNPLITPTFTQVDPICNGDVLVLPTTSNNGVTGTWSPAMDNTATTLYTFAPDTTQPWQACAINETMEITVNPLITPTFTQVDPICNGEALAVLPITSNNGVTGIWSPAIDNTATTLYTFAPDTTQPGQACAVNETMTITVNPITPTFTQVDPICNGEALAVLPITSNNGVIGTWSPAIDNTATTIYTFVPDTTQPGQDCAVNQTMEITVNPLITTIFTQVAPICNGDVLAVPTTSNNGITGTWSPAIDNTLTTTYTFTPDITQPGQACAVNQTMIITVNQTVIPIFDPVASICEGESLTNLPTTSKNGVLGVWSPAMNNMATTTYTFTPDTSEICADIATLEIVVNEIININLDLRIVVKKLDYNQSVEVYITNRSGFYEYKLDEGLWQDSNLFENLIIGEYSIAVREKSGCSNESTILFLLIDYPRFFTPNSDGINDTWNIEGLESQPESVITIFDRFGKTLSVFKADEPGWNGICNGKRMPSNDYWFKVSYFEMEDRPKIVRSNFSLLRK